MIELKGGHHTVDARLDRVYEQDLRSLDYLARDQLTRYRPRSYTWRVGVWLDQMAEGSCVGHGYGHELAATPVPVAGVDHRWLMENIYWPAQVADEWPGGSYPGGDPFYEGTSVLAGAKVLTDAGFYTGYDWGITAKEVALCVGYLGPAVLGVQWYEGMFEPDVDGFLNLTGAISGGHCLLAYKVKIVWRGVFGWLTRSWDDVDLDASYLGLWNSWGPQWGEVGTAKVRLSSLAQLIDVEKGEACFPRRNPGRRAV